MSPARGADKFGAARQELQTKSGALCVCGGEHSCSDERRKPSRQGRRLLQSAHRKAVEYDLRMLAVEQKQVRAPQLHPA